MSVLHSSAGAVNRINDITMRMMYRFEVCQPLVTVKGQTASGVTDNLWGCGYVRCTPDTARKFQESTILEYDASMSPVIVYEYSPAVTGLIRFDMPPQNPPHLPDPIQCLAPFSPALVALVFHPLLPDRHHTHFLHQRLYQVLISSLVHNATNPLISGDSVAVSVSVMLPRISAFLYDTITSAAHTPSESVSDPYASIPRMRGRSLIQGSVRTTWNVRERKPSLIFSCLSFFSIRRSYAHR